MEHCEVKASSNFMKELLELRPALIKYAHIRCYDNSLADDIAQDTIEKAIKNHHLFKEGTNMKAWLFRILLNTLFTVKQREKRCRELINGEIFDKGLFTGRDSVRNTEKDSTSYSLSYSETKQIIQKLPKKFSEVITLVDIEERSYEEVVKRLNIPMGTVMSRLFRARNMLAQRLTN